MVSVMVVVLFLPVVLASHEAVYDVMVLFLLLIMMIMRMVVVVMWTVLSVLVHDQAEILESHK